jgi:hypothetical protein
MNRFILCLLFLATVSTASSQKVYFVYLQSENEQPFFVKINEQVHSSTASGYLILSRLRDSTYNFSVGFPQDKWPEQNFSVKVNKKDHGYIIKNFGEKGWGLFDLKDLSVQMSSTGPAKTGKTKTENAEVSAFTDILAKAADDPSLKDKAIVHKPEEKKKEPEPLLVIKKDEPHPVVVEPAVIKKEENKPVTIEPAVVKMEDQKKISTEPVNVKPGLNKPAVKENLALKTDDVKTDEVKTNEVKTVTPDTYKPSSVTKGAESSTSEGFGLVFIDKYEDGTKDTIRIVIPNPKPVVALVKEEPKEEKKFIEILVSDTASTSIAKNPTTDNTVLKQPEPVRNEEIKPTGKTVAKNNCKGIATENDFLKLRKKMAAETDDDDMVDEARKYFKITCFTTLQVKNLGALFLDDLGKYKFFDVAYLYVSDVENFSGLESELKNEYYVNRFKAMLK